MPQIRKLLAQLAPVALAAYSLAAVAETVDVTVDGTAPWIAYANLFELPTAPGADRGAYWQGLFLGADIAALPATIAGDVVTLAPNTSFGGSPADGNPVWWTPDGQGGFTPNKVVEANVYVDSGVTGVPLDGKTVRFTGITTASSLTAPYAGYAFIREFAADYSVLRSQILTPLVAGQSFVLSMDTLTGSAVQYGFALVGPNADPAALQGLGTISVTAVPEPATLPMLLLGALAVAGWARRKG